MNYTRDQVYNYNEKLQEGSLWTQKIRDIFQTKIWISVASLQPYKIKNMILN
jgi:hypothetical protein